MINKNKDIDYVEVTQKDEFKRLYQTIYNEFRHNITAPDISLLLKLTWFNKSNDHTKVSPAWERDLLHSQNRISPKTLELFKNRKNGFTAFYAAYRGDVDSWTKTNFKTLKKILNMAVNAQTEEELLEIASLIERLPRVPGTGNGKKSSIPAANLVTPLVFLLDPRAMFPVINKRPPVQRLIKHLCSTKDLVSIVKTHMMYQNYSGLSALELDSLKDSWSPRSLTKSRSVKSELLPTKDKDLRTYDTNQLSFLTGQKLKIINRRHNILTNLFKESMNRNEYLPEIGAVPYDIMVSSIKHNERLLIEAKGSCELTEIRMGIGQLFHYHHQLSSKHKKIGRIHLCLLLPEDPGSEIKKFLKNLNISLIYRRGSSLKCLFGTGAAKLNNLFKRQT